VSSTRGRTAVTTRRGAVGRLGTAAGIVVGTVAGTGVDAGAAAGGDVEGVGVAGDASAAGPASAPATGWACAGGGGVAVEDVDGSEHPERTSALATSARKPGR
jgi:hypothetical protein